jgi:predicted ester cyclase
MDFLARSPTSGSGGWRSTTPDEAVIVECKFGGTHRGPLGDIAPTGKTMEVQAVLIFVFDEDRLICEKVYYDRATILRQLGM